MKLFLLRHAHSAPGERMDAARGLSSKGHRQVKLMRQFRKDLGIKFDVVFSSDFARAVETLQVANKKAPVAQLKELRPNGTPEDAWRAIIAWLPDGARKPEYRENFKALVITHDPLIQKLAASVGFYFSPDVNAFPHCGMLRIDTHPVDPEKHPLRWFVTPDLIEHVYESDVVEAATQLTEHLGRESKARIVDPLINQLRRALARRFREQGLAYQNNGGIAIAPNPRDGDRFRSSFLSITKKSYEEGASYVGNELGVLAESIVIQPAYAEAARAVLSALKQPPGYKRTPQELQDQLDETTRERLASIESDGLAAGLTPAAIALAIRQQFRDWARDRAETIATHEISRAFHQGGRDVAKIVNGEHGGHWVERHWDVQDNPCELCEENSEAGWIGEDEQWPNYPDGCPGHVGCVCSESYRTVSDQSAEARRYELSDRPWPGFEIVLSEDYNPDQPRDDHGRWVSTGAHETGIRLGHSDSRAFTGKQVDLKTKLSKLETGQLGEKILIEHLKLEGHSDAHPLNAHTTNFPVDGIQNHEVIEMKTGIVSNGRSAQQWRATIGQPGKEETKWLKTASADEKRAWNQGKAQAILDRKEAAVKTISQELGRPVRGSTMTVLLNPDTHTADIYKFDGFHSRIDWNSAQAKAGYIRSVTYGHISSH